MRTPDQPRSQFLQLGLHFAYLLADCESFKRSKADISDRALADVVQSSRAIIDIFLETTDERTRHLTDHVYNVVTFAALTLCRIMQHHHAQLRQAGQDLSTLNGVVEAIIRGLSSVGPSCHAANMLAGVVAAKFATLQIDPGCKDGSGSTDANDRTSVQSLDSYFGLDEYTFAYPDFSRADAFDMSIDVPEWASWDPSL